MRTPGRPPAGRGRPFTPFRGPPAFPGAPAHRARPPGGAPRHAPGAPRPHVVRGGTAAYPSGGPGRIALTIDDGPSPVYTPQILGLLHRYRIRAAFSMIGVHVAAYPGVARDVADAGHMIVNHTWTHPDLAGCRARPVTDEIDKATDEIHRGDRAAPPMFRAPYWAWSPAVLARCQRSG